MVSPVFGSSRCVVVSRAGRGRPAQTVHRASQLCQRVGVGLPAAEHQGHALLAGGSPAPGAAAAGPGAAHAAAA